MVDNPALLHKRTRSGGLISSMRGASIKRAEGTSRRALAFAVAAVWLAAQVSGVLHSVFVPHIFCAEHGEFVDADRSDDSAAGGQVQSNASRDGDWVQSARSETAGVHGHEHCLVAARARRQVASTVRQPEPVRNSSLITEREWVVDTARRSLDRLFRLAPKNSPPL